jgi:hypothetical protein
MTDLKAVGPTGSIDRLWFTHFGADILDGIELRNGKANGLGWSTVEVWVSEHAGEDFVEHKIADLYCGEPINLAAGYGYRFERAKP